MGFWHTGYLDILDDEIWIMPEPKQILYPCRHDGCDKQFMTTEELRFHQLQDHPGIIPQLFVLGVELGKSAFKIYTPLTYDDVRFDFNLTVNLNGTMVPSNELPNLLAQIRDDTSTVNLSSNDVSATFKLIFKIAEDEHLLGVENAFLRMVSEHSLTVDRICRFIEDCRQFNSASEYYDAICHYLYGINAKEQHKDSNLSFKEYQERLNMAFSVLKGFNRRLSLMICSLVSFNINQFNNYTPFLNDRLNWALKSFSNALKGKIYPFNNPYIAINNSISNYDNLLTDSITANILNYTTKCYDKIQDQLTEIMDKERGKRQISEYDLVKFKIILGEGYYKLGDVEEAQKIAIELSHATTQCWAESMLKRIERSKNHEPIAQR
jgi:hypothetical protein